MTSKQHRKVLKIINTTTTEQQSYLLKCIADKIVISVHKDNGMNCHKIYEPRSNIYLNGIYISVNIDLDK